MTGSGSLSNKDIYSLISVIVNPTPSLIRLSSYFNARWNSSFLRLGGSGVSSVLLVLSSLWFLKYSRRHFLWQYRSAAVRRSGDVMSAVLLNTASLKNLVASRNDWATVSSDIRNFSLCAWTSGISKITITHWSYTQNENIEIGMQVASASIRSIYLHCNSHAHETILQATLGWNWPILKNKSRKYRELNYSHIWGNSAFD